MNYARVAIISIETFITIKIMEFEGDKEVIGRMHTNRCPDDFWGKLIDTGLEQGFDACVSAAESMGFKLEAQ